MAPPAYPEWFIGGTYDGEDKTEKFPHVPDWHPIVVPETDHKYTLFTVPFGGIIIRYWTDARVTPHEMVMLRLAELILEPHKKTVPAHSPEQ